MSSLQTGAEQVITGVEFQIGQSNRYEIYPDMNFISPPNMRAGKLDQKAVGVSPVLYGSVLISGFM